MHATALNKCNSDIHSFAKAQLIHGMRGKLSSFNGAHIYARKEKALSAPLRCY